MAGLVAALAAGLGLGVATSYLQGALPDPVNFLANSGAVWTVLAFAVAYVVARTVDHPAATVAAGLLALLGEVLGYYAIASPLRHVPTSPAERVLWVVSALVVGPLTGWAAQLCRRGRPEQRVVAASAVAGVVAGEGMYAWVRLSYAGQGAAEVAIAVVALVLVAWRLGATPSSRLLTLPAAAMTAVVVYVAYVAG